LTDLFAAEPDAAEPDAVEPSAPEQLAPGLWRLRLSQLATLLQPAYENVDLAVLDSVAAVTAAAPLRHLQVPGGGRMSVANTNCGAWGWTADTRGYRYVRADPTSGQPWPALPPLLFEIGQHAAALAGYAGFEPDACLINRYLPGASMGLHVDKDEASFDHPIVSISIGAPATFLWGGTKRSSPVHRCVLQHGDVLVWGGMARLNFHGVARLVQHPVHAERLNLTLRRAAL
jgi:DNA oxidative demethylase